MAQSAGLRVRIERVAPEGEGLGKAEGSDKVVFVPYALPGDVVEAEPAVCKERYDRARLVRVLEPSPSRVEPRCPIHFAPGKAAFCGGCDWQHAAYEAQLRFKRDIILDCLRRIAKLDAPVLDTLPSPRPWRYRNKVQVPFQQGPGGLQAGFYMPGTHRVVAFEDCVVQPEESVAVVRTVRAMAGRFGWRAYDERTGKGWLRHLYLRTTADGEAAVVFVTRDRRFPDEREVLAGLRAAHPGLASVWQNVQEERTSVVLGPRWRKLAGKDRLAETIGPLRLEFTPGAFLQVNTPAAAALYGEAERLLFAGGFAPRLALDLYSGVGAIALWMAPKVGRVVGVEESPRAVEDAYANARRLGVRNVSFVKGPAEKVLPGLRGLGAPRPWAAVLDPPRTGCDGDVLSFLARRRVERIVYVSCNPATFARDARRLADAGYSLAEVRPVDLFPQTSHVELVARLTLGPGL